MCRSGPLSERVLVLCNKRNSAANMVRRRQSHSKPSKETMKTRLLLAVAGLAIGSALPTLAQQKETVDPKIIEQLDAKIKKYDEAVNNNDAAAVAALFMEDAVFVTDGGPVFGRQAVEKWYADVFKRWHPRNHTGPKDPNSPRIIGTADNISLYGEWSETGQGEKGEPIQIKGYWSAIDTREGDHWKVRILTYNVSPAPAATPSVTTAPSN
jgi:uncharacterized protein (TIGR02246 family)